MTSRVHHSSVNISQSFCESILLKYIISNTLIEVMDIEKRILFVCFGNMCRSPMAEGLARDILGPDALIASAGTNAWQSSASTEAIEVMHSKGIDISDHQTRNVDNVELDSFDYIIAMDSYIFEELNDRYPEQTSKIIGWNIEDPMGQGLVAYKECADKIRKHIEELIEFLTD